MSATRCPECGSALPADAPRGLCPNCLLNAGLAAGGGSPASGNGEEIDSIVPALPAAGELKGDGAAEQSRAEQPVSSSVSDFRRTAVELGLMDAGTFDRMAAGFGSDVEGLVRSLSRSGLVTVYQAAAIRQGKARGLVVGDYLVLDKLGQGGMGVVFKAWHRRHGVTVALKILPPRLARDRKLVLRFRREIHAAALLVHPNIVAALDADEDRGVHFLTMEYIEGIDLDGFIKNGGALPVAQAVDYVMQAARGLAAAHARGIIHRDIKPGNLMLDARGTIRVLDLGLALVREGAAGPAQTAAMTLTQAGAYMGTVDFMAPEQAQNSHTVDHRADIYSLGCTLHFLLTARPPFEGATPLSRLIAHHHSPAPSLRDKRADVPQALDAVYQAMLAKRPEDRPASMTEVIARLEASLLAAALAPPAPAGFLTVTGPARIAEGPSTPVVANARASQPEKLEVADVVAGSNSGVRATEAGLVESAALVLAVPATISERPAHGGMLRRRPLAVVASLGGLAAITAAVILYALNGPDSHLRALRDRPAMGLAANGAIEPAESEPLATKPPAPEPAGHETQPDAGMVTPPKEPPAIPPAVASSGRRTSPENASRTAKKRPEPTPSRPPSVASTLSVATFDGVPCFRGHKGAVRSVAVSWDGTVAVSSGADHYARRWFIKTGVEISAARHPSEVYDTALSPDGRFAFTCTKGKPNTDGAVRFWNMSKSPPQMVFTRNHAHTGPINAVAMFRDGRALSGGQDGQIVLWNLLTEKHVEVGNQKGPIHAHAIAFFPRGVRAAAGGQDGLVHIWIVGRRRELRKWPGHQGPITSIAISAHGERVVSGSSDGTVILWDSATGSVIRSFPMPDGDGSAGVAILPDGNVLAAGNVIGHLILWDARTGRVLRQSKGPSVKHGGLALMPDGQRVLTADEDGVVRMWTPRPK